MLVSHDRAFLDNVTKRTIEISLGKIYDYKASWSKYLILREERREQQIASYRNQQKMIEDTEKFIESVSDIKLQRQFRFSRKSNNSIKLKELKLMKKTKVSINLRFPPAPRSGTVVVEAENLSKSFGSAYCPNKIDFKISRGEKVAFVGRNGEGKTTFSKIIIGELDYTGTLKIGHNVKIRIFCPESG